MQPLHEIVSIAPSGEETPHWQIRDLPTAKHMAAFLSERLKGREVVKLRCSFEVAQVYDVEFDFPPAQ